MKYSQTIGITASIALISICFMPWSYVEGQRLVLSGMNTTGTSYGRPGLMNIVLACISAIFFAVPRVWSKRTNIFITMFNFAWAIRNYILLTSCYLGDCPQKRAGVFLLLIAGFVMLLMSFLPRIEIKNNQ